MSKEEKKEKEAGKKKNTQMQIEKSLMKS